LAHRSKDFFKPAGRTADRTKPPALAGMSAPARSRKPGSLLTARGSGVKLSRKRFPAHGGVVMPRAGFSRWKFGEQERFVLLLIAPAALLLLLFQVVPIAIGGNASFRDWALYNPKKSWVGFAHYAYVITDPAFLRIALPNTFLFMFVSVSCSLVLGLAFAVLLNRRFRGQKLVQTVLLLPLMVAPVIAAIMIRWMFNDQFGIVNVVIEALGFEGQPWLAQRWSAFGVIVLTDIWLWTPWFTLLLLAGLQSLPKEPFEAAAIDGTTPWRVFRYLTLPMLRPVIAVCVVIRAIDAFRTFDIVWTLTGGGPARSTELFSLYAYVHAFLNLDFGRGSAAAMIGGAVILVFGMALYRIVNHVVKV
jgi:multiple sugar transport system permease protein